MEENHPLTACVFHIYLPIALLSYILCLQFFHLCYDLAVECEWNIETVFCSESRKGGKFTVKWLNAVFSEVD